MESAVNLVRKTGRRVRLVDFTPICPYAKLNECLVFMGSRRAQKLVFIYLDVSNFIEYVLILNRNF